MPPKKRFMRIAKFICVALLYVLVGCVAIIAVHVCFDFCPLAMSGYNGKQEIVVAYGLPDEELISQARRGEIVLGGCWIGPVNRLCPYCRWPCCIFGWGK